MSNIVLARRGGSNILTALRMSSFELNSSFKPSGDQEQAIGKLLKSLEAGNKHQGLLGVTGSGKTFTMANLIARMNRPTLVISHNKTLAAQLHSELKSFFPNNAVDYYVSYYDYYQPEAYIPHTDTFIEKDSAINDELDRLSLNAMNSLMTRRDVIVVASVSCIYGLGAPEEYFRLSISLRPGMEMERDKLLRKLIELQYSRNDIDFKRSTFRVRGDAVEIFPASNSEVAIRVEFFGDEIDRIITASSHDQALCFSNFGRVYALPIYQIPEGSRTSKGKAIVNLLDIAEGESIVTILPVSRFDESHYVFLATVNGVMKKTSLKEFAVIRSVGKAAIALDDGDSILTAVITDGTQDIMVFGSNGKVLRFDENEVRPMGRAARGVLTMKLPEGHKCISMFAVHADTNMEVLTVCANGYGKRTPLADHPKHGRRSQGQIAIMTSERNGELVAATLVNVEDTVLVLTNNGRMIRTTVESIRQSGRATQGVKLMETLDETVVSVTRVANEDSEDVSTDAESHGASALAAETTADSGEFPVPASDENGENK